MGVKINFLRDSIIIDSFVPLCVLLHVNLIMFINEDSKILVLGRGAKKHFVVTNATKIS